MGTVIPSGSGKETADLAGGRTDIFTYRPAGCALAGMLIVFHGLERNASDYRDYAKPLGDRLCLIVGAPLFDKARFPTSRYQRGGIVDHGIVQSPDRWTGQIVVQMIAWLRAREAAPTMPCYLIGHSAGGQFLSRMAAFVPNDARRIVIANPSTWVLPTLNEAAPYGFGGVAGAEVLLRRYLAAPVTVFLGQADLGANNLADDEAARQQGPTRLVRGERTFAQAQAVAREHGWAFGWRLIEVPNVGHSARSMFASPLAVEALSVP